MYGTVSSNNMSLFYINDTTINLAFFSNDYVLGTVDLDVWQHWAVTYDGNTTLKAYKNGVQVFSNTGITPPNTTSGATNYIGRYYSAANWFFSGQIDDARIYNYALSASQIKKVMSDNGGVRFGPSSGQP